NAAGEPVVSHHGGWVEYLWRASDVPAQASDDDEPGWYDPFASVQWSEYRDWAAVAAWAVPLYKADADQGAELSAQVDAIAAGSRRARWPRCRRPRSAARSWSTRERRRCRTWSRRATSCAAATSIPSSTPRGAAASRWRCR